MSGNIWREYNQIPIAHSLESILSILILLVSSKELDCEMTIATLCINNLSDNYLSIQQIHCFRQESAEREHVPVIFDSDVK